MYDILNNNLQVTALRESWIFIFAVILCSPAFAIVYADKTKHNEYICMHKAGSITTERVFMHWKVIRKYLDLTIHISIIVSFFRNYKCFYLFPFNKEHSENRK